MDVKKSGLKLPITVLRIQDRSVGDLSASCFPRFDLHLVALREMAIGLELDSGEKNLDQRDCLAGTRLARMDGSARFRPTAIADNVG